MLVALVLSMALAPLLIRHHDVLARFLSRTGGVIQPPQAEEVEIAAQTARFRDHVIICGAGEQPDSQRDSSPRRRGASVTGGGRAEGRGRACRRRVPVFHGDASRPDTLLAAGLAQARLVVLTFDHAQQVLRIAQAIAERRPALDLVGVMQKYDRGRCISRHAQRARVPAILCRRLLGWRNKVMSTLGMSAELVERNISAMRRCLDSGNVAGSPSA